MVGGLSCRGCAIEIALDALIAHTADIHRTALHLEIRVAVDAVAYSRGDVQREVLHRDIVTTLDGVLGFAHDIECAVALQLDLALAVETGLLRTVSPVGEGIHGVLLRADLNALAVGDIDSGSSGVGECESGQ